MSNPLRTLRSILFGLVLLAGSTFAAGTGIIQGTVKGPAGKPVADAKVTIALKDARGASASAKTDGKGNYTFKNLEMGTYNVNVTASGLAATTATDVKPRSEGAVRIDFALKAQAGTAAGGQAKAGKKPTHMVWVPAQTGSNLGGRWVEVDDQGSADGATLHNVKRAGGGVLTNLQNGSGKSGNSGQ